MKNLQVFLLSTNNSNTVSANDSYLIMNEKTKKFAIINEWECCSSLL